MHNLNSQYIIIINPNCHQGKGWDKWFLIKEMVMEKLPKQGYTFIMSPDFNWDVKVTPLLTGQTQTIIISAGGDGSVHYLINYLMGLSDEIRKTVSVGAVGLGSSNDFLKPVDLKMEGIPVKLDYSGKPLVCDVGIVHYIDKYDVMKKKYFIINASIGVTAFANFNFNHPNKWIKYLKKYLTSAAILCTAIFSIFSYQNIYLNLKFNERTINSLIANINVLKIPYVSGGLHYSVPVKPDDGRFSLNICFNMNKWELLKVLYNLGNGIFHSYEKALSVFTDNLEVSSPESFIFECDGETEIAKKVTFSIVPKAINILK